MTKGKAIGAAMLVALATAVIATAETVVSGDFSIGLGKTSATGAWTTTETAGVNTDVTGPFTLSVAASCSGFYGSSGTTFQNRLLGIGATGVQYTGKVSAFDNLTVTATYTGGLPGNGSLTLVIDSVRIWANNGVQSNYVYWAETTPGNTGQQPYQGLGAAAGYLELSDYQNIVWNPGEKAVSGTSSTRTFDLSGAGTTEIRIDGIEVFGHVEYNDVPGANVPSEEIHSPFDLGFGYNALDGSVGWDEAETSNSNTHVTGDFALAVSATSGMWSSSGATFADRVLGVGFAGTEYTARSDSLVVTVAADYTGGLSGYGATPMTLVIDSIGIHAGNYTGQYPNEDIRWEETTPGNAGNSPWVDLGVGGHPASSVDNYDHLAWNPGEVAVPGTNSTRTFVLETTGGMLAYVDGIEIAGRIAYDITSAELELLRVDKISFDAADHSAFTSLVRYDDMFYCTWREGTAHVSDDGKLRVARSPDGTNWTSVALISKAGKDLRDSKLRVVPDGRLMLHCCERDPVASPEYRNLAWFSSDGTNWVDSVYIAEDMIWFWKHTWRDGTGYGVGYSVLDPYFTRLYTSTDATNWTTHVYKLFQEGIPSEASIAFMSDGTAHCLLRRDYDSSPPAIPSAQLGTASPPYTDWTWQDLGIFTGGPEMIRLPGNRLLAAMRLAACPYAPERTSLCWIDPDDGTLTEALTLPCGGDSSYAGMVWYEGRLWISYYSSHETNTAVYMAEVAYNPELATIMGVSPVSGNIMKMIVDAPAESDFIPVATTNLVDGIWTNVPHSGTNDVSTMVFTNLGYSTTDTNGNAVIYVEADETNKFFRIIAE